MMRTFIFLMLSTFLFSNSNFVKDLEKSLKDELKQEEYRLNEFKKDTSSQQNKLNELKAQIKEQSLIFEKLQTNFKNNELFLERKEKELNDNLGDLGNILNSLKQSATKIFKGMEKSYSKFEYPKNFEIFQKTINLKNLNSKNIENFWLSLTDEIIQSGLISEFNAQVIGKDGKQIQKKVTRIGPFSAFDDEGFLILNKDLNSLVLLNRQPSSFKSGDIDKFSQNNSEILLSLVDVTKGDLFKMQEEKPTIINRIQQGGLVGYVIIFLGILGLIYGFLKIFIIHVQYYKIKKQLKNLSTPEDNPLGKIIEVFQKEKDNPIKILEVKISEEIITQSNKIEYGKDFIKLLATTTPLLGLLGTVTGMITTFQSITMFGTGDPKLMAGGISSALITTVLGLVAAIPLLFIYSYLSSSMRKILSILEEQSIGIMAKSLKSN